jgi:hypothetical protein
VLIFDDQAGAGAAGAAATSDSAAIDRAPMTVRRDRVRPDILGMDVPSSFN